MDRLVNSNQQNSWFELEDRGQSPPRSNHDDDTGGQRGRWERGRSRERSRTRGRRDAPPPLLDPVTSRHPQPSPDRGGTSNRPSSAHPLGSSFAPSDPGATSDVMPAQVKGWLWDRSRGRRLWCTVAGKVFSVLETPDSLVPKQVLLLPGCRVGQVGTQAHNRDKGSGTTRPSRSGKATPGAQDLQFWLEDRTKRHRFLLGAETKAELERWVGILSRVAASDSTDALYTGIENGVEGETSRTAKSSDKNANGTAAGGRKKNRVSEDERALTHTTVNSGAVDCLENNPGIARDENTRLLVNGDSLEADDRQAKGAEDVANGVASPVPSTHPQRIDVITRSLGNALDVGKGSVGDICKKLKREQEHNQELKSAVPIKATHQNLDHSTTTAPSAGRRFFSKVGVFESLFRRTKKRSASADDASCRAALGGSKSSCTSSRDLTSHSQGTAPGFGNDSFAPAVIPEDRVLQGSKYVSKSWEAEKASRSLSSSIRRSASDLKTRLFSNSGKPEKPGLRLAVLKEHRLSGWLLYKGARRWAKLWVVLSRGSVYGFKSEQPDEAPVLSTSLSGCTATYVTADRPGHGGRRGRGLFVFKLTQTQGSFGLTLACESAQEMMTWLKALQQESCSLLGVDDVSISSSSSSVGSDLTVCAASSEQLERSVSAPTMYQTRLVAVPTKLPPPGKTARVKTCSESSTCSAVSEESGVVMSRSSTLTSSSDKNASDGGCDVSDSQRTRHTPAGGGSSSWSLLEEVKRRHGLELNLDSAGFPGPGDLDDVSSQGSSSRGSTSRREEAVTQVWGRDAVHLLQLIRTKLRRRKRREGHHGLGTVPPGEFYDRELSRSHDGDLLIEHDHDHMNGTAGPVNRVLLNEARHRSHSYSEGKAAHNSASAPADDVDDVTLHPGWNSTPGSPRGAHQHDSRSLSQRHLCESQDSPVPRTSDPLKRPHNGDVSDDVSGTRGSGRQSNDVTDVANNGINPTSFVSSGSGVSDDDAECGHESKELASLNVRGSYAEAWEEYSSGGEGSAVVNNNHIKVNGTALELTTLQAVNSSWILTNDYSAHRTSEKAAEVTCFRANTIPRQRPVTVYSSLAHNARDKDQSDSVPRYSANERLGRKPRGPISNYYQRTQTDKRTRAASVDSQERLRLGILYHTDSLAEDPHAVSTYRGNFIGSGALTSVSESSTDYTVTSGVKQTTSVVTSVAHSRTRSVSVDRHNLVESAYQRQQSPPRSSERRPQNSQQVSLTIAHAAATTRFRNAYQVTASSPQTVSHEKSHIPSLEAGVDAPAFTISSSGQHRSARTSLHASVADKPLAQVLVVDHIQPPEEFRAEPGHRECAGQASVSAASQWSTSAVRAASASRKPSSQAPAEIGKEPACEAPPRKSSREDCTERSVGSSGTVVGALRKVFLGRSKSRGRDGESDGGSGEGPAAVMAVAATCFPIPAMHGYLLRKTHNDQWIRYWHVLNDDWLYCYLTPDDHLTVDVTDLSGYKVLMEEDKIPGHPFVIHLQHEDYIPVYLATLTRQELKEWDEALTLAVKGGKAQVNSLGLNSESQCSTSTQQVEDRALHIKQRLLAEVLRQKQELERKQAARQASKQKQLSYEDGDSITPPLSPSNPTGEQIGALTRLKQRRMSAQIKMDTLQRHMQTNGHTTKKPRFTFGKKKPPPVPPDGEHGMRGDQDLKEQLRALSDHLSALDRDLLHNGGVMTLDRRLLRQRKADQGKTAPRQLRDLEGATLESGGRAWRLSGGKESLAGGDDGSVVGRSNSLKSSVQKLAHRTFAKATWYRASRKQEPGDKSDDATSGAEERERSSSSVSEDPQTSTTPAALPQSAPDVIDLSHRLTRTWPARDTSLDSEDGGVGEMFLPPPSSFNGDPSYSPLSSPRSARSTGSGCSDRGPGGQRGADDVRMTRRQVDPEALATIEAFEMMLRQVLGEGPT